MVTTTPEFNHSVCLNARRTAEDALQDCLTHFDGAELAQIVSSPRMNLHSNSLAQCIWLNALNQLSSTCNIHKTSPQHVSPLFKQTTAGKDVASNPINATNYQIHYLGKSERACKEQRCNSFPFSAIFFFFPLTSNLDLIQTSQGKQPCQGEVLVPEISPQTELMSWPFHSESSFCWMEAYKGLYRNVTNT